MAYKRISPQPIVEGGTNATSMTNADGVVYYNGTRLVTTAVGSATQVLTSNGVGMAPTFQASAGGSVTFDTDAAPASPSAGIIIFDGISQAGSSVSFSGSGNTVSLNTTDANGNTIIGLTAGNSGITGTDNVGIGINSLSNLTTGINNTVLGAFALNAIGTGQYNTVIGSNAANAYSGAESSNIIIGNAGVNAESHVLRIGTTGTANLQQSTCYIAGVSGVNVGSVTSVVSLSGDQLGSTTITPGAAITVTGGANTITIASTGGGFTWNDITGGSATLVASNGYVADKSTLTTFTLPVGAGIGDSIKIVGKGTGGWKIVYGNGQQIIFGSSSSTLTTGNVSSTNAADCLEMVCTSSSGVPNHAKFTVVSSIGNPSIT